MSVKYNLGFLIGPRDYRTAIVDLLNEYRPGLSQREISLFMQRNFRRTG